MAFLMVERTGFARCALAAACVTALASPATAHPHVFAEARLDVVSDGKTVTALRHVWRFDEYFSATVSLEFDRNGDGKLDTAETAEVGDTIKLSTAEFNFFNNVFSGGTEIAMQVPGDLMIDFVDGQMIVIFETTPASPIPLDKSMSFGIFDPTFYTSIEFPNDSDLTLEGFPKGCNPSVIRPDPDEVLAQNQATLTEQFFADPAQNDVSRMFATRLEVSCA